MEAQHLYNFAQFGQDVPTENNEVDPNGKSFIYHNILNCAIFFIDFQPHAIHIHLDLTLILI